MKILQRRIVQATTQPIELINITPRVLALVQGTGIRAGLLTLISPHTTARININEHEDLLQRDMIAFLKDLAPPQRGYGHDRDPIDGRPNAHAHLLGLVMNASETIPIIDGRLALGAWQSIFLCELDGPRPEREVLLHFFGEG